ncbi:MAG: hypothetical protein ACQGVC_04725 [Myxococcota bacterium]
MEKLDCPTCGGQAEVVRQGPEGRDRILSCLYCGSEVDLPEVRGTTRERVTERPGERVVERVTSWEGAEPELPDGAFAGDVEVSFETDGQSFGSIEEMERHLRGRLPDDVVEQALSAMRGALDGGSGTTVVEHTVTTTETIDLDADPQRRR